MPNTAVYRPLVKNSEFIIEKNPGDIECTFRLRYQDEALPHSLVILPGDDERLYYDWLRQNLDRMVLPNDSLVILKNQIDLLY